MLPVDLIAAKRDHKELSTQQIDAFISGIADHSIPDYQVAAMVMAVFLNGMTPAETTALTHAMLHSGQTLRWPGDHVLRVDKHSTGGVGDKTSLILAPLLAELGFQVPMLSGRGLGPTGGTLDKLESIPGFRTNLAIAEIQHLTQTVGCVITGTTAELAPADKRLYAIRDVTATVPSVPLITASILSKKLAESLDALVLDVKFGSGAFMKTLPAARQLATTLASVAQALGTPVQTLLTDMNQPLGQMCGNALEVHESLAVLKGHGPADVRQLTLQLAAELLLLTKRETNLPNALAAAAKPLDSGHALQRFERMVHAQGGSLKNLPLPANPMTLTANQPGFIHDINTEQLGLALIELGAGRTQLHDQLDLTAGIQLLVRVGDPVLPETPLAHVFSHKPFPAVQRIHAAFHITPQPPTTNTTLVHERIPDSAPAP